jgi:hypothetical protein
MSAAQILCKACGSPLPPDGQDQAYKALLRHSMS